MIDSKSLTEAAARDSVRHMGCLFLLVVGLLFGAIGIWATASHFEAAAYNRVTGSNVSTWDAMWIELRVQAGPSGK